MDLINIIILGLVQGVTEFLPVSSSGHLVLARIIFKIPDVSGTATDAFLHLGTLLAVLTYYWKVWWGILRGVFVRDVEGADKRQLLGKLLLATVPAGVVGFFWEGTVDRLFRNPVAVAGGFALTAIVFFVAEAINRRQVAISRAGWKESIVIGFAQTVALLPGVSRSGMTIAAGRAQGLSRSQSAHFSFLMSAPIIAGAGIGTLPLLLGSHAYSGNVLFVGFLVSFIAGLGSISLLIRLTQKVAFTPFAIYLLVMAAVVTLLL